MFGKNKNDSAKYELLLDAYYESQAGEFLETLRQVTSVKKIAGLADRMKADPRPWVRDQVMAYLAGPLDVVGHQPLVKRLYKHAEATGDHELMAHFLVAFDRLVRRQMRLRRRWDWQTRQVFEREVLIQPPNTLPADISRWGYVPKNGRLYSYRTRHYLRRRAWRYFRRLGHMQPAQYVDAVCMALRLYTDADLARGEYILDSRGLLQITYHYSAVLVFTPVSVRLAPGQALGDLRAAPSFPALWQTPDAAQALLDLAREAQSHLVRLWATQMLLAHHEEALANLGADALIDLLTHPDDCVQAMAMDLLKHAAIIDRAPIDFWLRLLEHDNPGLLPTLCALMQERVSPERLDLPQCVKLACAAPSPVAALGLAFLRARPIRSAADRQALIPLSRLACDAQGAAIATWALSHFAGEHYDRDVLCDFLDSLQASVREAAWNGLLAQPQAAADPVIWARLAETPWDDMRLRLLAELERRADLRPGADVLAPVWTTVLLSIHRGGRHKPQAIRQVADAIAADPEQAERLLPVLRVALRSIRGPEVRAGLAAVVGLGERRPELRAKIEAAIPELRLQPEGPA